MSQPLMFRNEIELYFQKMIFRSFKEQFTYENTSLVQLGYMIIYAFIYTLIGYVDALTEFYG